MADEPQNPALPGDIVEAIAVANLKAVAEQPASLANLALANLIQNTNLAQQNAVAHQQAMNQLSVTIVGKVVEMLTTLGPEEARDAVEVLSGDSVAEEIADLRAALGANQAPADRQESKTAEAEGKSVGVTLENLSGDALATAFAVLNAILGGKSDKGGRETP